MSALLLIALSLDSDFTKELQDRFDSDRRQLVSATKLEIQQQKELLANVLRGKVTVGSARSSPQQSAIIVKAKIKALEANLKSLETNNPPYVPVVKVNKVGSVGKLNDSDFDVVMIVSPDEVIVSEIIVNKDSPVVSTQRGVTFLVSNVKASSVKEGQKIKMTKIYEAVGRYEMKDTNRSTIPHIKALNISKEDLEDWAESTRRK